MRELKTKTVVDERFQILDRLGAGGMGVVYKAQQVGLDRIVALKVILPHLVSDPNCLARFEVEAQALSSMKHRNISLFYAYGIWHGRAPYIAMEYLDKGDLAQLLVNEGGRLSWRRTLTIARQIAEGVAHAHKVGIIHRDLKPSNIFLIDVQGEEVVKVADFGLAKIVDEAGVAKQKLTATGLTVGSPQYMSPEQVMRLPPTKSCDIYALGCIMYQCLFGKPPFSSDGIAELLSCHLANAVPMPKPGEIKDIPTGLINILQIALAKDPAERFAAMEQMADAIRDVLATSENMQDAKTTCIPNVELVEPKRAGKALTTKRMPIFAAIFSCAIVFFVVVFNVPILKSLGAAMAQDPDDPSMFRTLAIAKFFDPLGGYEQAAPFYDAAKNVASNQGRPWIKSRIALDEAAMFKRVGATAGEQGALKDLASDLVAALRSHEYTAAPQDEQRAFALACAVALGNWHPPQTKVFRRCQSVPKFLGVLSLFDEQDLWNALWTLWTTRFDSDQDTLRLECIQVMNKVLQAGHTAPYRALTIQFLNRAVGNPRNLTRFCYEYSIIDQSEKNAIALKAALAEADKTADGRDAYGMLQSVHEMLWTYMMNRSAAERIEFCRSALRTEDRWALWDDTDFAFRRQCEDELAELLIAQGMRRDVISLYEHGFNTISEQISPFASAHYVAGTKLRLAEARMNSGDVQAALRLFTELLGKGVDPAIQRFAHCGVLCCTDRLKGRQAAFATANAVSPMSRAEVLAMIGQPEAALKELILYYPKQTIPDVRMRFLTMIGRLYAVTRNGPQCLLYLKRAVEFLSSPSNSNIDFAYRCQSHFDYAKAVATFGREQDALRELDVANTIAKAIQPPATRDTFTANIARVRGDLAFRGGRLAEALKCYKEAQRISGKSGLFTAHHFILRAATALANGDRESARRELWRANTYQKGTYTEDECSFQTLNAVVARAFGEHNRSHEFAQRAVNSWEVCSRMTLDSALSPDYQLSLEMLRTDSRP